MESDTHREIVQREAPVLRQVAEPVRVEEFGTGALGTIVLQMGAALTACDDGVALAAPQIGVAKRIFIVSPKVFAEAERPLAPEELVFINPRIVKLSAAKRLLDEGCLSVRGVYGKIKRAAKATVEAEDLTGKKFVRGASGLLAQIFQHETDHLDGVLFIDKAEKIGEVDV